MNAHPRRPVIPRQGPLHATQIAFLLSLRQALNVGPDVHRFDGLVDHTHFNHSMNRQRGIATGWLYLIGLVALIAVLSAAVAGVYHSGKKAGMADIQEQWDTANRLQREREMKQAAEAEKAKGVADAKAKVVYRTITKKVDKIVEKPVYRDTVCLDDDGLSAARSAIRGSLPDSGKPDGTVPDPTGTR